MKLQNNEQKQGFTIIEVVLVLAIAGLIFLIVFLAVPALQRSQRDTQRKSDLGRFMSEVTNFQSNSQGSLPATNSAAWNTFIGNYLSNNQQFADPQTGNTYAATYAAAAPAGAPAPTVGNILVYGASKCGGNGVTTSAGARNFAAVIFVEQGGFYCLSNNN